MPEADAPPTATGKGDAVDVGAIIGWLTHHGLLATPILPMLSELMERIAAVGLPIWRLNASTTTLHPQYSGFSVYCRRGQPPEQQHHAHRRPTGDSPFERSPLNEVLREVASITAGTTSEQRAAKTVYFTKRWRLHQGEGLDRYEILRQFQGEGATDYLVVAVPYGWGEMPEIIESGVLISWTGDRPGGFTDGEVDALIRLSTGLALVVRTLTLVEMSETVMRT